MYTYLPENPQATLPLDSAAMPKVTSAKRWMVACITSNTKLSRTQSHTYTHLPRKAPGKSPAWLCCQRRCMAASCWAHLRQAHTHTHTVIIIRNQQLWFETNVLLWQIRVQIARTMLGPLVVMSYKYSKTKHKVFAATNPVLIAASCWTHLWYCCSV